MNRALLLVLTLCLVACGSNIGVTDSPSGSLPPLPVPDGQGKTGPSAGIKRAGMSYDVTIKAADGNTIAFTVHEPLELTGGQKYPLLLNGPGFAGPRSDASQRNFQAPAGTPLADTATTKQYTDAGYGVISFDQRGFGGSTGTVTLMDPDKDGLNLVQIVDWAESNLDWLMYRNSSLVLGAYGASYGGLYQYLLNNVDPRHRLKAMVPSISPYELAYSLDSGDVPKTGYGLALYAAGQASSRGNMDPATTTALSNALTTGHFADADKAYLHYHSNAYFCEGVMQSGKRAAIHPPKVDVLLFQGMADALFNLNEARDNYECLRASGGDVRLMTYVIGHVLPTGVGAVLPIGTTGLADYYRCGPNVADALSLTWMNAKLKLDPAAITALNSVPGVCINLGTTGEGVVVDKVPVGGTNYSIPTTIVPELTDTPQTIPLFTATQATVVAGIATATLTLSNPVPTVELPSGLPLGVSTDDAIVFVSFALSRSGAPAQLEVIGDQVRPVHGFGTHTIELNGIGIKIAAGDQLHLLINGMSLPQYPLVVARNPLLPAVSVSGTVQVPILGNVSTVK